MNFELIVAVDNRNGIGKNNKIPWGRIKEDLNYFRKITTFGTTTTVKSKTLEKKKNVVLMGRKTFDSIGGILKNRLNFVISKSKKYENLLSKKGMKSRLFVFKSIKDCVCELEKLKNNNNIIDKIFIIGGGTIYMQFLIDFSDMIEKIYITRIDMDFDCDVFFPKINKTQFLKDENYSPLESKVAILDDGKELSFIFELYVNKNVNAEEFQKRKEKEEKKK